ncbi:hypothetical protein FSP39_008350 [Pinctada imbricata]|uniref:Uncharacterized protein n=1 Tax=Pinctada imbricata TaxID=66713 RepID=A0AA88XQR5_PINIB|nr:hypothetical protein FSP39_008350 [Pinctada imbricata]
MDTSEALQGKIEELNSQLEECRLDLVQSAEIGKQLLEENEELRDKLERSVKEHSAQLEVSEQKIYELQNKYDCQVQQQQWYNEEMGQLREDLASQKSSLMEKWEVEKLNQIAEFQKQINNLRCELDEANDGKKQLEIQVRELDTLLRQKEEFNQTLSQTFHLEEIGDLQQKLLDAANEANDLKSQIVELRGENQRQMMEMEKCKQRIHDKESEIESLQCQCSSYSNKIEHSKMEKMELEAQLDAVRMEMQGHSSKGNSLFSEVEDRRISAEKKMITMKSDYDSLQKRYDLSNEQLRKMKAKMVQYLEFGKGKADSGRIEELEKQLNIEMSEKKKLREQVLKLEKDLEQSFLRAPCGENGEDGNGDDSYKKYLLTIVQEKSKEIENLKKEMKVQDMLFLDQRSKLLEMERTLYDTKQEKEKYRITCLQKDLKIEEMIIKYEPDSFKGDKRVIKMRREKIVIPEEPKEIKVKDIHSETMQNLNRSSMLHSKSTLMDDSVFASDETMNVTVSGNLDRTSTHSDLVDENDTFKKPRIEERVNLVRNLEERK